MRVCESESDSISKSQSNGEGNGNVTGKRSEHAKGGRSEHFGWPRPMLS